MWHTAYGDPSHCVRPPWRLSQGQPRDRGTPHTLVQTENNDETETCITARHRRFGNRLRRLGDRRHLGRGQRERRGSGAERRARHRRHLHRHRQRLWRRPLGDDHRPRVEGARRHARRSSPRRPAARAPTSRTPTTRPTITKSVEASLKRLQMDALDLVQLHCPHRARSITCPRSSTSSMGWSRTAS